MLLRRPAPAEQSPLEFVDLPEPKPADGECLVRVRACGICHTDLHTVEGEITGKVPVIPGHQIVGEAGGQRVGIPWLHATCGTCDFCRQGRENLCERAEFTGFHVNGGYAELAVARKDFIVPIPDAFDDAHAAPLLCAGIIGYRALRLALNLDCRARGPRADGEMTPSGPLGLQLKDVNLGLYGFGASAHIAIQIARYWGCEVFVSTRSAEHQRLARELGATLDISENSLDAAVIFAPAGALVPVALRALRRGGTLALAGIYMTPIPELRYEWLYHERTIRSVANATREDARQLMELAGKIPLRTEVETFPLAEANRALLALKHGKIRGAGVLVI
jgi:propanol-preferring alcohol dehydrogenase